MTRTAVTLAVGLALVTAAIGLTLSGSPIAVIHANSTVAQGAIAEARGGVQACQGDEELPSGTSAIRLSLTSASGSQVSVQALSGSRVLTSGAVESGWIGGSITIPVRPVVHTTSHARICLKLGKSTEQVALVGQPTSGAVAATSSAGARLPGRIKIEYLRADRSSWWSAAPAVVKRMGLGRAPSGSWIVLLIGALMGVAVVLASWVTLKELR
jgi:hypothetical protein